jgi:phosphatidylglycerophosphatase A
MLALLIAVGLHAYAAGGRRILLVLTAAWLLPAIWASTRTARLVKKRDPSIVVIDEVLGQWVTLIGARAFMWKSFVAGFVLFRLLDVWKPWPVRALEKLPEGTGIVADDIAAGLYGALILYIGGTFRLY